MSIGSRTIAGVLAAGILAVPVQSAIAQNLTVNGQIRLSLNNVKTGTASNVTEMRDNASRLSFKGTEDLGNKLRATFGLELGLNADSGQLANPAFRHSYVGLGGRFGNVAFGRLDSGTSVGAPFYSQATSLVDFAANDAGATAINVTMLNARNRTSNSIGYASPALGGVIFRARAYFSGEGTTAQPEDSIRSIDLGAQYARGPLLVAVGYGKDDRSGGLRVNDFDDKLQLGARYSLGQVAAYSLIGRDRFVAGPSRRRNVDYWLLGTSFSTGPHKFVLNVMERDVQTSLVGERRRWQAAWTYALSRRSELQAFIDRDGVDSSRNNVAVRVIGIGTRHNF